MALRRSGYRCERCGVKQSRARGRVVSIEVHHKHGVDWAGLIELIISRLLPDPDELECLCKECHEDEHRKAA
jgi:hypothetical protein